MGCGRPAPRCEEAGRQLRGSGLPARNSLLPAFRKMAFCSTPHQESCPVLLPCSNQSCGRGLPPAPPNSGAHSGVVRVQNFFLLKKEKAFKSRFYVLFSTLPIRSAVLHVPHIVCGCIWDPTVAVPPPLSAPHMLDLASHR